MRVVVSLASNQIIQTESEEAVGTETVRNGQYVLQVPEGVALDVYPTSYILPQDSGSLPYQAAAGLLARYPLYDHVLYNYFLEDTDIAQLDLTSSAPQPATGIISPPSPSWSGVSVGGTYPKCQVGRGSGGPVGVAPNSVVILPVNSARTTPTHGSIVTALTDLTPYNSGNPGTDHIMMWWEIATVTNSEDIVQGYGINAGVNEPSLRRLVKTDPEPSDFFVYVSVDDGASWTQAEYLDPVYLGSAGVNLRIAFLNTGTERYHLLGFAALFQDLP